MFVTFMTAFAGGAPDSGVEKNILRIQDVYKKIKDLKGSFKQTSTIKDLDRTDTYQGFFFIKYPMKMKWVYTGNATQEITINSNKVLVHNKSDKQAYKGRFDRSTYGQTPVALLTGFGDIRKEFDISGDAQSLTLIPKQPIGNITSIRIIMSQNDFPFSSFIINDGLSNVIRIDLSEIQIDTGINDSLFELSVPEGVSVHNQDQ